MERKAGHGVSVCDWEWPVVVKLPLVVILIFSMTSATSLETLRSDGVRRPNSEWSMLKVTL